MGAMMGAGLMRVPGEFEPQKSVWLSWPIYNHVASAPVEKAHLELVGHILRATPVVMVVGDLAQQALILARLQKRGTPNLSRLRFHVAECEEIWMRDFGPRWLTGPGKKAAVARFQFNGWGYSTLDAGVLNSLDQFSKSVAQKQGASLIEVGLTSEGGDHEFDGQGTMMLVEQVEFQRNPGLTREQIEGRLSAALGVSRFIWLKKGPREDDHATTGLLPTGELLPMTTGGHVDNFARFVSANTIALAYVSEAEARRSPIAAENRKRMLENEAILRAARTPKGRPYRIIRFPIPDIISLEVQPGEGIHEILRDVTYLGDYQFPHDSPVKIVLAASYLNFLITNQLVIGCKLYAPGRPKSLIAQDRQVLNLLRRAFPGRRVVMMDATAYQAGGGGIHCVTMNEPR